MLPVAFALAMALVSPTTALAAEEGHVRLQPDDHATTTTTTTPATTPTPTTGTSPSKESSTPEKTTAPAKTSEPDKTSDQHERRSATSLPFTGFDLRWTIGLGLLLMAMGFSIVVVQRRQRRGSDNV